MNKWSKNWLNTLNPDFKIIPLQIANCDRLENNDSVFIFDEVGSGKTLSSGLMAMHYHKKYPNEKVLVITIPALAKTDRSLFLNKWKWLFPSEQDFSWVTVINNHCSNIEKIRDAIDNRKASYGLVIVDEAHLFLNEDTRRAKALKSILENVENRVFLTATPIKDSKEDLKKYLANSDDAVGGIFESYIAASRKDSSDEGAKLFDLGSPVTRCFKGVLELLPLPGLSESGQPAKRSVVLDYIDNNETAAKKAAEVADEAAKSGKRSVIFVRYIKDAKAVGKALEGRMYGTSKRKSTDGTQRCYYIVTGENSDELRDFDKQYSDLPDVLILTYQTAEQGVDLPGYDQVVNLHIPAYPSALDQRFGRIDRMGEASAEKEISTHYLVRTSPDQIPASENGLASSKPFLDINTFNLLSALNFAIRYLFQALPTRNTLLSRDTIEFWRKWVETSIEYAEKMRNGLKELNKNEWEALVSCLKGWEENGEIGLWMRLENISKEQKNEIGVYIEFCLDHNVDISEIETADNSADALKSRVEECLKTLDNRFRKTYEGWSKHSPEEQEQVLKSIEAGILTIDDYGKISVCTYAECAKIIENDKNYENYCQEILDVLEPRVILNMHREALEKSLIRTFNENGEAWNELLACLPFRKRDDFWDKENNPDKNVEVWHCLSKKPVSIPWSKLRRPLPYDADGIADKPEERLRRVLTILNDRAEEAGRLSAEEISKVCGSKTPEVLGAIPSLDLLLRAFQDELLKQLKKGDGGHRSRFDVDPFSEALRKAIENKADGDRKKAEALKKLLGGGYPFTIEVINDIPRARNWYKLAYRILAFEFRDDICPYRAGSLFERALYSTFDRDLAEKSGGDDALSSAEYHDAGRNETEMRRLHYCNIKYRKYVDAGKDAVPSTGERTCMDPARFHEAGEKAVGRRIVCSWKQSDKWTKHMIASHR